MFGGRRREMKIESDHFRFAFSHVATGVSVVTGYGPTGAVGMSANSVTSLSLEPPLLLFCPAKSSETWPTIRETGRFCVNVLAHHHETSARIFAARGIDRFAGCVVTERSCGPALADALAWMDCEIVEEREGGDHTIVIGSVTEFDTRDGAAPLVFFKGRYGTFLPAGEDQVPSAEQGLRASLGYPVSERTRP
jgi:flavin reductase (DIM6/NTAB) family NADH-FMN oxidoreductase RutF